MDTYMIIVYWTDQYHSLSGTAWQTADDAAYALAVSLKNNIILLFGSQNQAVILADEPQIDLISRNIAPGSGVLGGRGYALIIPDQFGSAWSDTDGGVELSELPVDSDGRGWCQFANNFGP